MVWAFVMGQMNDLCHTGKLEAQRHLVTIKNFTEGVKGIAQW